MPASLMLHEVDPRQDLLDKVGDVSDLEISHNEVLVAIYMSPEKTRGGIIRPDSVRDEDKHQGKVGLIIKTGPQAYDEKYCEKYGPESARTIHDWIVLKPSDGWQLTLMNERGEKIPCRMLSDTDSRMRIPHPDRVW